MALTLRLYIQLM